MTLRSNYIIYHTTIVHSIPSGHSERGRYHSVGLGLRDVRQARTPLSLRVAEHTRVARTRLPGLAAADQFVAETARDALERES